jgi:hypothetical protein
MNMKCLLVSYKLVNLIRSTVGDNTSVVSQKKVYLLKSVSIFLIFPQLKKAYTVFSNPKEQLPSKKFFYIPILSYLFTAVLGSKPHLLIRWQNL